MELLTIKTYNSTGILSASERGLVRHGITIGVLSKFDRVVLVSTLRGRGGPLFYGRSIEMLLRVERGCVEVPRSQ